MAAKRFIRSWYHMARRLLRPSDHKRPGPPEVLRHSWHGALMHIKNYGFMPGTVIDVGAANGTPPLYQVFPEVHHILIEPLVEFEPQLADLASRYPHMEYMIAAAARQPGAITFYVHDDLVGSSMLIDPAHGQANSQPRTVPAITLDDMIQERNPPTPFLLKIDVQGAELEVLAGAANILDQIEYILLEVSFFRFFSGNPEFAEVISTMRELGFVPYDLLDNLYRPLDHALAQIDIAFVKENGLFRSNHAYMLPEQFAEYMAKYRAVGLDS
jgi:FkbM family methyltransferase